MSCSVAAIGCILQRMATLAQKIEAENRVRELLESSGSPPPDEVEYGYTCIRLLWHEEKVAIVVQIDEPPEGWEAFEAESEEMLPPEVRLSRELKDE